MRSCLTLQRRHHADPLTFDAACKALILCHLCSCEAWTSTMGFKTERPWRPWTVSGGYVAGYTTGYAHNFTYATVKGAGHMVNAP